MSRKTTVILVPGAWHSEHAYHKLIPDLERRDYETRAIRNPSLGRPAADNLVDEDAKNLRSVVDSCINGGNDVIVVAHSYGGSVLSLAVADCALKRDTGDKGKLLGLVYIAAFLLPEGKSFAQIRYPPDGEGSPIKPDESGMIPPPDPYFFYNDLPEDEQRELHTHLLPNPGNVGRELGKGAPWRNVPTVYIKCSKDVVLPQDVQQKMLDSVQEEGNVRVVVLDSSHSPMLSMPKDVGDAVDLVNNLAREKLGRI